MPHLIIEYSPGFAEQADINNVCRAAYEAMKEIGIFPLAGIRIRAYAADHCIVADDAVENNFVALTLSVGAGRGKAALKAAGDKILAAAESALVGPLGTLHFALSLEIRIIDSDLSWKNNPIHARLSDNK